LLSVGNKPQDKEQQQQQQQLPHYQNKQQQQVDDVNHNVKRTPVAVLSAAPSSERTSSIWSDPTRFKVRLLCLSLPFRRLYRYH
jgi:hypothetical protein